jgi:arsenate reductase-like glutaredoxin family protein
VKKVKYPASIMVWGCMSAKGTGKLQFIDGIVNANKYIDILNSSFLPSIQMCSTSEGEFIFQQDGAPCHTAKIVKTWLQNNNIPVLEWTSSSPDLSPIESIWHLMKKELRKNPARTVAELRTKLQHIWDNISPEQCTKLISTMPRRIQAVLSQKGDVTQF